MVHGPAAAQAAAETARRTFEQGESGEGLPRLIISRAQLDAGLTVQTANTMLGFTSSNTHARQLMKDGAIYLGDECITDPNRKLTLGDFSDGTVLLSSGKKKKGVLALEGGVTRKSE
jgi:tyrosyl-tRNA synthetase